PGAGVLRGGGGPGGGVHHLRHVEHHPPLRDGRARGREPGPVRLGGPAVLVHPADLPAYPRRLTTGAVGETQARVSWVVSKPTHDTRACVSPFLSRLAPPGFSILHPPPGPSYTPAVWTTISHHPEARGRGKRPRPHRLALGAARRTVGRVLQLAQPRVLPVSLARWQDHPGARQARRSRVLPRLRPESLQARSH